MAAQQPEVIITGFADEGPVDKKAEARTIRMVLPERIGQVQLPQPVTAEEVRPILQLLTQSAS